MKKLVSVGLFLILVVLSVACLQHKYGYVDELGTQNVLKGYYQLDENTVDVVSLGTSAVQRGWIVPDAYEEYGVASYNLATASQPFCLTEYMMREAEKTQNPQVYLIDIRSAIETPDELQEGKIRRVTDTMKESPNRWRAIKAALDYASYGENDIDSGDISYYLKIAKYHTLFDPTKKPKDAGVKYYGGFAYYEPSMFDIVPMEDVGVVSEKQTIDKNSERVLNSLLDYCDSLDAKVIFTLIPYAGSKEELAKINTAEEIVEKRGYTCLDFLDPPLRDVLEVDFDCFFYNERHTNYYGSTKYTRYICEYLKKECNIKDRRNDNRYSAWENVSKALNKAVGNKYNEMINQFYTIE